MEKILELFKVNPNHFFSIAEIETTLGETEIENDISKLVKYRQLKEHMAASGTPTFSFNENHQELYEGRRQMERDKEHNILKYIELTKFGE
jgi:thioredoxin-related protein